MATQTEPTFEARFLDDISVVFDPAGDNVEFRDAVQSFQFSPAQQVSTTFGGSKKSVWTALGPATWSLAVKFLQDIENATSLQNYLLANAGKVKTVRFIPNKGKAVQGDVILAVPPIGGDVGSWLDGTITMGVKGAPTITAPAGP